MDSFASPTILALTLPHHSLFHHYRMSVMICSWYQQLPRFSYKPGQSVLAALNQSDLPSVPAAFQEVIDSGAVRESMQTGTCPRWTSDSPTTLRAGSSACGPGLLQRDCPPQASPLRSVAAEGGFDSSAASFEPRLPVPLLVEGVMHVDRSVVIGMGFIVAHRTSEQLAPLLCDADPASDGEPLPPGSTSRAILRCPMRIGFDGHYPQSIGFLPRNLLDFAAQLVGLPAVHAPRFVCPFRLDLAQALKQQHTAGILRAHRRDAVGHFVGGIGIHAAHMPPQLLIAPLPCHRPA